jgi:hypothetical protein
MPFLEEVRGTAPVLAVFMIFVLLCSWAAILGFQSSGQQMVFATQQLAAADFTRAVALAVEGELNETLRTSLIASMYEAGRGTENQERVEQRVRSKINERINIGWEYSNFREIFVPFVDENSLTIEWSPDGRICALSYLDAKFEHITGPTANGLKIHACPPQRFLRLKHVAELLANQVKFTENIENFEIQANENFMCEGLAVKISDNGGELLITVLDVFGAKGALVYAE